ncbi:MAG: VOC family protein [Pseudomonadota bacterium]|nr:VOC family protein [Pseudomonadota bacterium]
MTGKIPEGFHTVTPYLTIKDAAKAIELYKQAFGAVEGETMRGPDGKIGHACLTIGDSKVFLADENPKMGTVAPPEKGSNVNFYLYVEDADAAQKKAIAAGMKEAMPVKEMFWGDRLGAVTDPFGYKWNLATQVREMTEEEVREAAKKAFNQAA